MDVKILQQLLAVHEGIEAVKWLMEERSTLTSRCSSLTSSQYSLGDTSWRGSWSSLQDPNDKLDNISIGSYLDTLADDMDEYCPSSSESVICSTTPLASEVTAGSRTGCGPGAMVPAAGVGVGVGVRSGSGAGNGVRAGVNENRNGIENGAEVKDGSGLGVTGVIAGAGIVGIGTGKPALPVSSLQTNSEAPKQDTAVWTKAAEMGKESLVSKGNTQIQAVKANGVLEKSTVQTGSPTRPSQNDKLGTSQSPKLKPYKNGKIDLDTCKMNGKMHLEYDAHWRWVQSQEDVTFL